MTGCPTCGGTERSALAPGFWVCRTEVLVGVADGGTPVYQPCGHEYQDGPPAAAETCSCGMFAVGVCRRCARPLCGRHGTPVGAEFLCAADAVAVRKEKEAADRQRSAERYAALPPSTVDVLRDLIDRRVNLLHAVRWQSLTGREVASLVPSGAWSNIRVGDEAYGFWGRKIRGVYERGFIYRREHTPGDDFGHSDAVWALLSNGDRLVLGGSGADRPGKREPADTVVFDENEVSQVFFALGQHHDPAVQINYTYFIGPVP